MKNMILALAVTVTAISAFAYPRGGGWGRPCYGCRPDAGDALTVGAFLGSLSVSTLNCSANYDCKEVIAAHDDLAVFVAAQGADFARTAAVDQVLQQVRAANGLSQDVVSDTDLAAAVLQKAELESAKQ